jgi:uncharacterized damage-inducible protein DinB
MRRPLAVVTLLALVVPTLAQPPKPPGFRAEFLADLDEVQKKIVDLAAAVPADKYTWRPEAGVRSVSEVYMHIAGGNYFLLTFLGRQMPDDMPQDIEKITDKQKVLAQLRKSFDYVRTVVKSTPDADFDKPVSYMGTTTTERGILLTLLNHLHEHLGQSIAYARMNGVVPPWSRNE